MSEEVALRPVRWPVNNPANETPRVHPTARLIAVRNRRPLSRQESNKGYGVVVALGDRILAQAHDTAVTARDPSLHAEVNAIRAAIRATGDPDLCGAVLFSTCEPCPMCAALAVWANLTTLVFGATIAETAARGRREFSCPQRRLPRGVPA